MADITLAEFNGRVWLVGGENYIDELLFNSLSPDVTIAIVTCDDKASVHQLWTELSGDPDGASDPWIIHPGIVDRIRRTLSGHSVRFAEWSAAIDDEGRSAIAAVASWWRENNTALIELVAFAEPNRPQSVANLSQLRVQLIEEALVEAGVPVGQIRLNTREAHTPQDSLRVDLVSRMLDAT